MDSRHANASRKQSARHCPTCSTVAHQYAAFRKQPAQMSDDEVQGICQKALAYDSQRPLLLASLTKSGAELIKASEAADAEGAEAVARAAVQAGEYAQKLREMANFVDAAGVRLLMALCGRKDMEQLIERAQS
jgi:hypothetical protein